MGFLTRASENMCVCVCEREKQGARADSPNTDCISHVAADGADLTVSGPVLFGADTAPWR